MKRLSWAAGALGVVVGLSGCNDCGTFQYKGVRGTEWCGNVYGTEGSFYEIESEPSADYAEITFGHSVPPGEFDFGHTGGVSLRVLWEDLESKEPLNTERVLVTCSWIDFADPFDEGDDITHDEPPTEFALQSHGARLNLDVGNAIMRKVSWNIVCGDGVMRLEGRDNIDFARLERSAPDTELLAHVDAEPDESSD